MKYFSCHILYNEDDSINLKTPAPKFLLSNDLDFFYSKVWYICLGYPTKFRNRSDEFLFFRSPLIKHRVGLVLNLSVMKRHSSLCVFNLLNIAIHKYTEEISILD